jgi:NhaA family Na+:H+ antiporter
LANAGVSLSGMQFSDLAAPVTLGIALGLFVGKPLGIVLFTIAATKALRTPMPHSVAALTGVGWIAGIGFTMSLFIGALAFSEPHLIAETRVGVFAGSIAAAFAGLGLLAVVLRHDAASAEEEHKAVAPFLVEDEKT